MARLCSAWLVLAAPAPAGVLLVDAYGFGDHLTMQAAIDAAVDGDIIVVRPVGELTSATIAGKSLTLIADVGTGQSTSNIELSISGLPAGGQVVVRGFHADPAASFDGGSLFLQNCAGSVWIEDCRFPGLSDGFTSSFVAQVQDSPSVSLIRCDFAGTAGLDGSSSFPPSPGVPGGGGVLIVNSVVALHECSALGGDGGDSTFYGGAKGGHAVELRHSSALLAGCQLSGGDVGAGGGPAIGGDGLLLDATSAASLLDDTITGGLAGLAIDAPPGAVQALSGSARSIMTPAPKREGQGGLMVLSGQPGDVVGFFWSFRSALFPVPGKHGWFLLDSALLAGPFWLGVITSPSGVSNILFSTPSLPPSVEGLTFLMQAYFQYPGGVTLGSGTAFVALDIGL